MNYMKVAIELSLKARDEGNVPVGCVIVKNNKIIAKAYNKKNSSKISVYHAEIIAIIEACRKLNNWYLEDCEMYVTLKPCDMCTAAIAESRIKKVYYLLDSDYENNLKSNISYIEFEKFDDNFDYKRIIGNFFKLIRK